MGYGLTFSSIFWQKSKAMAVPFRPFLADFSIFEKEAKNGKKGRL